MTAAQAWVSDRLDYQFGDPGQLERAITHRSAAAANNERLEFLGDAVLGMVIAAALYEARPDASEGELTRLRARLVRKRTLAEIGREMDLASIMVLGRGEASAGANRDSILADGLEAVIGAVYLDGGSGAARRMVLRIFQDRLENLPHATELMDAKTRLQEALQARGLGLPEYTVVSTLGPDHAREFQVACKIAPLGLESFGQGSSRQRAEQAAAGATLKLISDE